MAIPCEFCFPVFFLLFIFELHNGRERTLHEALSVFGILHAAVMPFHFGVFGVYSYARWKSVMVELSNEKKQQQQQQYRTKKKEQIRM